MMQQQLAKAQIDPLPDDLCSPQSKLVYLYLEAAEGATLNELNETLSMKKMDVLTVLRSLSSDDLVDRDGDRYVATH